ncbi:spore germination protein [Paenibacillus flagellatus]|uniref:Spore germination protein n=1 Tax=Paenibacillus flagellatus TaxID=2211139 RepID=A0A2V5KCN7_9BACL|nr:spore germination protein [Paenibacillus flagellatus]PYI55723.1 spore germination protein [Paenibacillus flagellatus]
MNTDNNTEAARAFERLRGRLPESDDIESRSFAFAGETVRLLYISSVCDEQAIQSQLIRPFYDWPRTEPFGNFLNALNGCRAYESDDKSLELLLCGSAAVLLDGTLYLIGFPKNDNKSIPDSTFESTVMGPTKAFSEDIGVNLNLIRNRYPQETLTVERHVVGNLSKTPIAMVYDEAYVDPHVLENVRRALSEIDADVVQAAGQLHRFLTKRKRSLFPTMVVTERPDRTVFNLSQGKIVFLLHGTSFVLVLPSVFYDFMSAMDDIYQTYWVSKFIVTIRYVGLILSLTLASLYVALTSYNPEILRIQLALSIAGSRAPVPYPSFFEVTFMLLMMEMLTEASIRLPKSIGSTATTVGGLILGQAATQAGLISNIMIIIVSAVAISNFVIPITAMTFGMRLTKYVLLLVTTMFGIMGLMVGFVGLVSHLASLESFGQPYLKLFMESPAASRSRAKR